MNTALILKNYIQEKGMKQTVIANKVNMNIKTLNSIINGHTDLKVDVLIKICEEALEIPVEKFLEYAKTKKRNYHQIVLGGTMVVS